jgi:CheY-like chemotaxis protein
VQDDMGLNVIAVVDDDAAICELLSEILTDEGYQVVSAASGNDGIALIAQHKPHLVILDFYLSGSINGLSVVEHVRANRSTADIPIIVSTAASNFGSENARELQALKCAFLAKPFEIDTLLRTVEHAINSSALECFA